MIDWDKIAKHNVMQNIFVADDFVALPVRIKSHKITEILHNCKMFLCFFDFKFSYGVVVANHQNVWGWEYIWRGPPRSFKG